jgi:hypothetical protein
MVDVEAMYLYSVPPPPSFLYLPSCPRYVPYHFSLNSILKHAKEFISAMFVRLPMSWRKENPS